MKWHETQRLSGSGWGRPDRTRSPETVLGGHPLVTWIQLTSPGPKSGHVRYNHPALFIVVGLGVSPVFPWVSLNDPMSFNSDIWSWSPECVKWRISLHLLRSWILNLQIEDSLNPTKTFTQQCNKGPLIIFIILCDPRTKPATVRF